MDDYLNPFTPGAGILPPLLSGREDLIHKADTIFRRAIDGRMSKNMIFTGLRGVGKTVLLYNIGEKAESRNFKVRICEVSQQNEFLNILTHSLRDILMEFYNDKLFVPKVKKVLSALKNFAKINIGYENIVLGLELDPSFGYADSGKLDYDLSSLLLMTGQIAKEKGIGVALIFDEMQLLNQEEISALVYSIQQIQVRRLPVVIMGAGLPNLIDVISDAKTYAERAFKFVTLEPLDYKDSCDVISVPMLQEDVIIEQEALDFIFESTRGYPYFLQEYGAQIWDCAQKSPITYLDVTEIEPQILKSLDENFFTIRFRRLTPKEREFLYEMAKIQKGKCLTSEIAHAMNMPMQSISQIRSSLIKKGMIYTPEYGYLSFTVPLFDKFMVRTMQNYYLEENEEENFLKPF